MKKRVGVVVDIIMYVILLVQMMYVFIGNNLHELLGIGFFVCLILHLCIKNWWAKTILIKDKPASRRFFDIITILLVLTIIILMLSSMGVSRFLFTWFHFMGSADLHRYLATAVLTLGVIHGGMLGLWRAKRKKLAVVGIVIASIIAFALGIFGVPFLNRQKRSVEISYADKQPEETIEWQGNKPLVVYFTRMGNSNFEPDVDAVSGASLLMSDGEMMGNNQLLAKMVCDITGFDSEAITLTGEKYPSSYSDTIVVAGDELKAQARPDVEPIDVSEYDSIILIYPLWWGSIPMPVATFLENNDFDGKTIYLIITHGSSGYGNTISEIEELCPNAKVVPGTSIYCEDIPDAGDQLTELLRSWNAESN